MTRVRSVFYLLAVWTILLPRVAEAQALGVSAKGGLDLSRIVFTNGFADDSPMTAGLLGGGVVEWRIVGRLAVRGEVNVAQERATVQVIQNDTFRYLDVPVLLRYDVMTLLGRRVSVSGGGVFRQVLDATETVAGESSSIKDGISSRVTALAVGASVALLPRWTIDVRYLHGRTGLYKLIGGGTEGRSRTIQVTAEWKVK